MDRGFPKVSIVMPTYNGSAHLRQAIDSCLNQTYPNIELIILDDGSTDSTWEIIQSCQDARIRYGRHKKNKGLPRALNTGFSLAIGEYMTWTSDDNEYLPTAIGEMVAFLQANPHADFVYADYWAHYLDSGRRELRRLPDRLALHSRNEVGPCFLYTRRVYQITGEYDPKCALVEDYDYWIRIMKQFQMIHYPHPLYVYGEHSLSLKGRKYHSITLFDGVLKYQHGYLSWRDLGRSISGFLSGVWRSDQVRRRKASLLLLNDLRLWDLSFSLGLFGTFLFTGIIVWKAVRKLIRWFFLVYEASLSFVKAPLRYSALAISKNKSNVLWILPYMAAGGSERIVLNIAKGVNREKFGFHLVTTEPSNHLWRDKFEPYFQNIVVPFKRTTHEAACFKYFCEFIERLHIDLVVLSNSKIGYRHVPGLKLRFPHLKITDILHSEEGWGTKAVFMKGVPCFDKRICISHGLKGYMLSRYAEEGVEAASVEKLEVIHNGIDLGEIDQKNTRRGSFKSHYGIPFDTKVISFIGRFEEEKNPLLFLAIAKNLLGQFRQIDVRFVMAGDGPYLREIQGIIERDGLKEFVRLTGWIDNPNDLMIDTSALLIVSRSEGIPLVAMEAMALGVPVVSTRIGAIEELICNERQGHLIDPKENLIEGFTEKVLDLLDRRGDSLDYLDLKRPMLSPEFSLEVMSRQYQGLFEKLLGSHE